MTLHNNLPIVMDRFDFDKVHKVMTFLNWTWAGAGAVPTIDQLKSCAYELLHQAVQSYDECGSPSTGASVATGGFQATVDVYDSGATQLTLLFYVDSCSNGGC
jgi:hypothetical protein